MVPLSISSSESSLSCVPQGIEEFYYFFFRIFVLIFIETVPIISPDLTSSNSHRIVTKLLSIPQRFDVLQALLIGQELWKAFGKISFMILTGSFSSSKERVQELNFFCWLWSPHYFGLEIQTIYFSSVPVLP